jgi:hypothetical protein
VKRAAGTLRVVATPNRKGRADGKNTHIFVMNEDGSETEIRDAIGLRLDFAPRALVTGVLEILVAEVDVDGAEPAVAEFSKGGLRTADGAEASS